MTRAAAIAVTLVAGCSVDRSALDDRVFECREPDDCLLSYGCEAVNGDVGYCAPLSEQSGCDGRTAVGTAGERLCLPSCDPGDDCLEGGQCVAVNAIDAEIGACVPEDAPVCRDDGDCPEGLGCPAVFVESLLRVIVGPVELPEHVRLPCIRTGCHQNPGVCEVEEECLSEALQFEAEDDPFGLDVCLARCDDDAACPMGFTCADLPTLGLTRGICIPGFLRNPCAGDASCFMGECVAIDEVGSLCLSACEDERGRRLCSDDRETDGALNLLRCEPIDLGDRTEICDLQSGYFAPCSTDQPGDCAEGLECQAIAGQEGAQNELCVRPCRFELLAPNNDGDGDCTEDSFCTFTAAGQACFFDLDDGSGCTSDDQCRSGSCPPDPDCDENALTTGCCT